MPYLYRLLFWVVVGIVAIALLMIFIKVFLLLSIIAALLAFAYYWFSRAQRYRKNTRRWS